MESEVETFSTLPLEARTPYGHQTLHVVIDDEKETQPERKVERLNIKNFIKSWRKSARQFFKDWKHQKSLEDRTKLLLNRLQELITENSTTKTVKLDLIQCLDIEKEIKVPKAEKSHSVLKDFYRACGRFFKNSVYTDTSDTRTDDAYIDVLLKKLGRNILPLPDITTPSYLREVAISTAVEKEEIFDHIKTLSNSNAVDNFGLSARTLKKIGEYAAPFIAEIASDMLRLEKFPKAIAGNSKVFGLWKRKGSRSDPTKYRPISILPWVGKILEKVILSRLELISSAQKRNPVHPQQHAYRRFRGVNTAVFELYKSFRVKKNARLLFVDYRGCFDAVSIQPLVDTIGKMNPSLAKVIVLKFSN